MILLGLSIMFIGSGDAYHKTNELNLSGDLIRSDELGNVFLIKDNQLTKFNPSGEKTHTYSNLQYGDISFIDTHDPFKILIYYQAFGRIEFLDHTLSLASSSIDLNRLYAIPPTLVCASYQGAFWVYDPINFELIRINQSLEINERSGNLQQVTGYNLNPDYLLERDNYLYLNDPMTGILIFDKYGTFYKVIPVPGLHSFQVFNNRIIYITEDGINMYNTKLNELSSTALPWEGARSVSVCLSLSPQRLYMLGEEKLFFYEIK